MNGNSLYSLTILTMLSSLFAGSSHADDKGLIAKPDKCVSLRKGQICYQRITLSWKAELNGHYCILASDQVAPLKCWSNSTRGKISYGLQSTENIDFHLINSPDGGDGTATDNSLITNAVLSTATVTIAWVYNTKSRNRTTWRLF